jgi:hypothetical protein
MTLWELEFPLETSASAGRGHVPGTATLRAQEPIR